MTSSESNNLAQAFASMTPEALSSVLAFLEETSVGAVMSGRISDWLERKSAGSDFAEKLKKRSEHLASVPQHQLCLNLYARINTICEIAPRHYSAPRDFSDNCEEIISKCLTLIQKFDINFKGASLHDLVIYQTGKMFGLMQNKFSELPADKQGEFLENIREFINKLPEEQRAALRKELNIDELSDEKLRTLLVNGALGSAFAATVSIGGFSFYMGASSLLAGFTHLLGFSLPFGVYTSMSSLIAVLSNPLFLMAALGGGAFWLVSKENKKMRECLVPLVITQCIVSTLDSAEPGNGNNCIEEALLTWQRDWESVVEKRAICEAARIANAEAKAAYDETMGLIKEKTKEQKAMTAEKEKIVKEISDRAITEVDRIESGHWGNELADDGKALNALCQKRSEIKSRHQSPSFWKSLGNSLLNTVESFETSVTANSKAKAIADKAAGIWEKGAMPSDDSLHDYASCLQRLSEQTNTLKEEIKSLDEIGVNQKAVWKSREGEHTAARQDQLKSEQLQWGMAVLV